MRRSPLSTLVLTLAFAAAPAIANGTDGQWLAGEAIVAALAGKTIEGRYANGRSFIEHYQADGSVEYIEGAQSIGGHWSVTAGTLCTIYDTDPTGGCFRVSRVGANCFEFYFTARSEAAAPGPEGSKPTWTARGSVPGEGARCGDGADV